MWLGLSALPAQRLAWQLPLRGSAEYQRKGTAQSATAPSLAAAAALENPRGPVPERYLPKVPPAAVLAQGELDAGQQAIADPPSELRDVLRAAALDLGNNTNHRFAQIVPFGDLQLIGAASPIDATGKQTLRFKVAGKPLTAQPGDEPFVRSQFLEQLCDIETAGTIVIERTIDRNKGLVRDFAADAALVLTEGKQRFRKLCVHEQWNFLALHENQDPAFRARVGAAVRNGTAWLQKAISGANASFLIDKDDKPPRSFGSGRLALAIQTLEHADVPATDPSLVAAWAELERRELIDTYSLGTALMALAARHAPPREAEMLHDGTLKERPRRQLPAAEMQMATRWVERMLTNVDKRTDPANCLRFNYTAAARFDTSVQQYGLLGLDAAQLCGVPIPATAWAAAAKHLLAVQSSAHGRVHELALQSHAEAQAGVVPKCERVPTRGFSYKDDEDPAYGSMTAAGITGLLLARAGIARDAPRDPDLKRIDAAIDAGFAWLAAEFTTRANPGYAAKAQAHWFYWLYGLERVAELAGVARLDGRDWYYEGALQLLARQEPDGSFRSDDSLRIDSTCFAILFLKKATAPVRTGR